MATIKEYRARQGRRRAINSLNKEGISGFALGESPLTLWLITAVIIVYLYIRRSHLGIDTHPAEKKPLVKPSDRLPVIAIPGVTRPPILPAA